MTVAHLPDAAAGNWVDRWAPEWSRPWLKLGRFDRPIGAWLLMLPGWQAVAMAGAAQDRWPEGMGRSAVRATFASTSRSTISL